MLFLEDGQDYAFVLFEEPVGGISSLEREFDLEGYAWEWKMQLW